MVFVQEFGNLLEAATAERQIKGWCRAKKEALISHDFDLLVELALCRNASSRNSNDRILSFKHSV